MRFVIYGAGAIGGVVAVRLHQSGQEVALIARGAHREAIAADGLVLETPRERTAHRLPVAGDPAELAVGGDDDVVLLAVKGQDTVAALDALRAAGADGVPIVCLQNGVENERVALRRCAAVYGAVVMLPAAHLHPGVVRAWGTRLTGIIDVGRYPHGVDAVCEQLCAALNASQFLSRAQPDVMRLKHAKLILNLGNAVGALCGRTPESAVLTERARAEGRTVLEAAGIDFSDPEVDDLTGRWERIGVEPIDGEGPPPSSSWQSLARGQGTIESDYLNGEISLLGRLHGVPTPINDTLGAVAVRQARTGAAPGALSPDEILSLAA